MESGSPSHRQLVGTHREDFSAILVWAGTLKLLEHEFARVIDRCEAFLWVGLGKIYDPGQGRTACDACNVTDTEEMPPIRASSDIVAS